jgi:hypothetical protein
LRFEDDIAEMGFIYDYSNIQNGWDWVKKCVPLHYRYMEIIGEKPPLRRPVIS